jgi:hypothetical protein
MGLSTEILAAAVSRIESIVAVHEERHPCKIALEGKQVEVYTIHRLNADANELFCKHCDFIILTDDPPVEIGASQSAFASKDDEHRLAVFVSDSFPLLIAVHPLDLSTQRLRRNHIRLRQSEEAA